MVKRAKSNRLYSIMIVDKKEHRDKSLSEILGEEYIPQADEKTKFVDTYQYVPLYNDTKNLSQARTWKTIPGAERFLAKLKIKQEDTLQIVDITDLWNSDIDKRIDYERKLFENRVKHLNTLKIN